MIKSNLPHENLYTRLKACSKGVGVFAIRDIPGSTRLFVGDIGETVQILVSDVDKLEDAELRRIYYDFCPVRDGCFVAPIDFNQMAMGWYLNHSDDPNVKVDDHLQFVTSRLIKVGDEVTANYTTYSQHAVKHIRDETLAGHGPDEPKNPIDHDALSLRTSFGTTMSTNGINA